MTELDLNIAGIPELREEFERFEDRWDDAPEYVVGTNVEYGPILEFGRGPVTPDTADALKFEAGGETVYAKRVSGHPPYPWFRPAVREFKRNPEGFVRDTTGYDSFEEIPNIEALVQAVASGLANRMKDNTNAEGGTDRSPGTHPDHPKRDTGNLSASIGFSKVK